MTKLKGARLQDLATALSTSQQISNKQLGNIKGGCSSCEDKRRPPLGG